MTSSAFENARHGLEVVRENLWASVKHEPDLLRLGPKVRRQDLDAGVGVEFVDEPDRLGIQARSAVGLVVARDPSDGRIAQPHAAHRFGDPARLVEIQRLGPSGGDIAEVAPAGARVPTNEEGRLAVFPALENVGATRLLAHRVQALALDHGVQFGESRAHFGGRADPTRFALDRSLGVACLNTQQLASLRSGGHRSLPLSRCVSLGRLGSDKPTSRARPADWA